MNKVEELLNAAKLGDLLHKQEKESKKSKVLWVLAIIGAVAAVAYAVCRFVTPDSLGALEDGFDGDCDDDFFDEEDESTEEQ